MENSKQTIQNIQNQLGEINVGVNKVLLNINGGDSEVTTNSNSELIYSLKQPITLDVGDRVTLIQGFVEEPGLQDDTISFEEDYITELRFLYYQQGDCRDTIIGSGEGPERVEWAQFPRLCPDVYVGTATATVNSKAGINVGAYPGLSASTTWADVRQVLVNDLGYSVQNWQSFVGGDVQPNFRQESPDDTFVNTGTITRYNQSNDANSPIAIADSTNVTSGANGQYFYLCETYTSNVSLANTTGGIFYRPVYGTNKIVIKAGNYSVETLANLVTSQMNGSLGDSSNTFRDRMLNKLYYPDKRPPRVADPDQLSTNTFQQTTPFFNEINYGLSGDEVDIGINEVYDKHAKSRVSEGVIKQLNVSQAAYHDSLQLRYTRDIWYKNFAQWPTTGDINYKTVEPREKYANGMDSIPNIPTVDDAVPVAKDFQARLLGLDTEEGLLLSKPAHFFCSRSHLYHLFERPNFYYNVRHDPADFATITPGCIDQPAIAYAQRAQGNIDMNENRVPTVWELLNGAVGTLGVVNPVYDGGLGGEGFSPDPYNPIGTTNSGEGRYTSRLVPAPDLLSFCTLWPVNGLVNPANITNQDVPIVPNLLPTRFCGTSNFKLSYDSSVLSRFALSDFHEPYKLGGLTADGSAPSGFAGQQATKFNNPYYNNLKYEDPTILVDQLAGDYTASAVYPVDSASGIQINNFSFELCRDTDVYKDITNEIAEINKKSLTDPSSYDMARREWLINNLYTKTFSDFFPSKIEALAAWKKSLWYRLGFPLEQLGDIKDNLETIVTHGGINFTDVDAPDYDPTYKGYNNVMPGKNGYGRMNLKQFGLMTHNSFDFTKIISTDGLGSGGLSDAVPKGSTGTNLQQYGLVSMNLGKQLAANDGMSSNTIHLLDDSKPIVANNLPVLNNGNSYLLIESDIVNPNFKDSKANWGNLLGIMSRENASQDTIFGTNPIPFTIKEKRLLTDITIRIKNPNGTLVSDDVIGKNSGFIIQIEKPINTQTLPTIIE